MTRSTGLLALALSAALLSVHHPPAAESTPGFESISPLPGSTLILPETNVILRPGGVVDGASALASSLLSVIGSSSGLHEGKLRLSDDHRTLTFQPYTPFTYGETVTCHIGSGLVTDARGPIPASSFSFTIAGPERDGLREFPIPGDGDEIPPPAAASATHAVNRQSAALVADSLPPDFPNIRAAVYGETASGRLFLADLRFGTGRHPSHLMILENDGTPFFHRRLRGVGLDFKMQPDGRLTYFDGFVGAFYALNARYDVVDSFRTGNGYTTDGHDLVLLPNGHAVLMSYDPQIMDLSQVVPGGQFDARVIGLILQELDRDKNVVFQWRSWDHFQLTDIVPPHSLTAKSVDYVHGNSVDVDPDGNLILCSRHMNEVTKISRATGEIIWRLGGKNNQFTFVNEPIAFSHQHSARQLPSGNLILFDNGNFRQPLFSRAVEYAIDAAQMTATLVWEHRLNPDVFAAATGSVQRLPNGNTLIGWGTATPTLTEVAADGSLLAELTFDPGMGSYRAFRFEWPPVKPATIAIHPGILNSESHGNWITALIRPEAAGFLLSDIEVPTVRLNGTVTADSASAMLEEAKKDSLLELTVKFARDKVAPLLTIGINRIEVSGSLKTGEMFRGFAELSVLPPQKQEPLAGSIRVVSTPGAIPVELSVEGAGAQARTFAVYDVQGRLVARWRTIVGASGGVTWNGRRPDGRRVGSGIYLIRAEDGARGPARKVVIAR